MKNKDFLLFKKNDHIDIKNKHLIKTLEILASKYGYQNITTVKECICIKCREDFGVAISKKQIDTLLRPRNKKFPYTAIIIIETIYNLLKEDRWGTEWKQEYTEYLKKSDLLKIDYEKCLLGNLPKFIYSKKDEFINGGYYRIFKCYADSRENFKEVFGNTSIEDCLEKFSHPLTKEIIPVSVYEYQHDKLYFKLRKG